METWLAVVGYEGIYEVSDQGQIRNADGLIMKPETHYKGHYKIRLCQKGLCKKYFVHRLVALAFIPNPGMLPIVNHKDTDKKNNFIWNLEWATHAENTQHYYDNRDSIGEKLGMTF